MLKRIPVAHLRVGMHLHELCGSWMDHPFWRSKFVLKDPKDITRILDSGIREVWIDTSKGLDIEGGLSQEEVREQVERELEAVAEPAVAVLPPRSREQALAHAAALAQKSKEAVRSMFGEARMGQAIDTEHCLPLVDDISSSVARDPGAFISIARLKDQDEYTYMHSVAVCALMVSLARQLNLDEAQIRGAGLAGLLHDIGKAVIPLEVLNKPGRLTDQEFTIMKSHPERGHAMLLEGRGVDERALDVCMHHHERIDGTGYPHRLKGAEISLFARMGAVCDVYDAVTSDRPYKRGWDPGEAVRQMAQWKGHFDPLIFQAFVKTVGIYPVGTLVRLQSGKLGVVVEQYSGSLLAPKVKVFYSTKSNLRIPPEVIDLGSGKVNDKVVGCESPNDWPFTDIEEMWAGQHARSPSSSPPSRGGAAPGAR